MKWEGKTNCEFCFKSKKWKLYQKEWGRKI